jgi:hypothetical protein
MSRRVLTNDDGSSRLPPDPSIDELDAGMRERLGRQWASRARAELRVAGVFTVVSHDLLEQGADPAMLRIAARAVSDEVRHAELCRALAARYVGRAVPWPAAGRSSMPALTRAPADLRPTLHTVAMGCVNETIASAWLEESLRAATAPAARAVIRELIADDIHHARLGWGHLASSFVGKDARRTLGAWLPQLLEYAAKPWTVGSKEKIAEGVPSHGVPSEATTRDVVVATLTDVVLPGFESLGVPTRDAKEWCGRRFESIGSR